MKIQHLENLSAVSYFRRKDLPITVRVMYYNQGNREINMHGHEFSELVIVHRGSVKHIHKGGTVRLRAGDFFVIHPGARHGYAEPSKDLVLYNVLYRKDTSAAEIAFYGCGLGSIITPTAGATTRADTLGHLPAKTLDRVVGYLHDILLKERSVHPVVHAIVSSLFTTIILELSRYCRADPANKEPKVDAILERVREDCCRHLTADALAKAAGLSKTSLFRHFQRAIGMGPGEYILQLRLSKARALLSTTSQTLAEIAAETGFHDASHLSRMLKARLRITPGQLRGGAK